MIWEEGNREVAFFFCANKVCGKCGGREGNTPSLYQRSPGSGPDVLPKYQVVDYQYFMYL